MSGGPIRSAIVVGDGIAAWTGAAALARRVPGVAVVVVGTPDPRPDLVDLVAATPPSSRDFHADLGLDEADILGQTRGGWRLGTAIAGATDAYVRAYGPAGGTIAGIPFASAWAIDGSRFDSFSPGAQLGIAGRMPSDDPIFADVGVGLSLDPAAYRGFIAAYARHLNVEAPRARLAHVSHADDRVTAITLDDGTRLAADLYVDATGAKRRLISMLSGGGFEGWSHWLPVARIIRAVAAPQATLATLDRASETDGGWHLVTALPGRTEHLLAYSAVQIDDGAAARALAHVAGSMPMPPVAVAAGRLTRAWVGNTVAIGDAQAVVGPIDAAPMQLLHAQVDRLVRFMPGRDFATVERDEFNRGAAQEADRLRDFQIAHARTDAPPATLADTLSRFAARGRWRQRDGELADRNDWIAVMAGTGIRPRIVDAVARAVDRRQVETGMNAYRRHLAAAVAAAPLHRATLPR